MKKSRLLSLVLILVLLCLFDVRYVFADLNVYKDPDSGLTFSIPDGWKEKPLSQERETIDVKFVPVDGVTAVILYGSIDIWGSLSESERSVISKSDISNSSFTGEEVAALLGYNNTKRISQKSFSGTEYFCVIGDAETGLETVSSIEIVCYVTFFDGYMYSFQFLGDRTSPQYADFETLIKSAEFPTRTLSPGSTSASVYKSNDVKYILLIDICISICITVGIYTMPIAVYRFLVKRRPIEKEKAKKICIMYGILSYLVMSILLYDINGKVASGSVVLFWSFVNFRILVGRRRNSEYIEAEEHAVNDIAYRSASVETEDKTVSDQHDGDVAINSDEMRYEAVHVSLCPSEDIVHFCRHCGHRLEEGSEYCSKCGERVYWE